MGDDNLEERIDPTGKKFAVGAGIAIGVVGAAAFAASYFLPGYKRELIVTAVASIPVAAVTSNVVYGVYMRYAHKD